MVIRMKEISIVYVCHTYYHVYVTLLKELNRLHGFGEEIPQDCRADIVISRMSPELVKEDFLQRIKYSGVFDNVFLLDERRATDFPELKQ